MNPLDRRRRDLQLDQDDPAVAQAMGAIVFVAGMSVLALGIMGTIGWGSRLIDWEMMAIPLASMTVGGLVMLVGAVQWRRAASVVKTWPSAPNQPWTRRPDWATGLLRPYRFRQRDARAVSLFVAAVALAVSAMVAQASPVGAVAIGLAGIAAGFVWYRREVRLAGNEATAELRLSKVPIEPGEMQVVTLTITEAPEEVELFVTLRAVRSTDDSETQLYASDLTVPLRRHAAGCEAAVELRIPADVPPTGGGVFWRLDVQSQPGRWLQTSFSLPVFQRVGESGGPVGAARVSGAVAGAWRRWARRLGLLVAAYVALRLALPFAAPLAPVSWERALADRAIPDAVRRAPSSTALDTLARPLLRQLPASRYAYRFVVDERDEVNAFAWPAGTIVVNRGLMREVRSPEELQAVLAHEIAHVERRHGLRAWLHAFGVSLLLRTALGDWGSVREQFETLLEREHSRSEEMEADEEAVRLLAQAGLRPAALIEVFERWSRREAEEPFSRRLLRTHPLSAERATRLKALIQAARTRDPNP